MEWTCPVCHKSHPVKPVGCDDCGCHDETWFCPHDGEAHNRNEDKCVACKRPRPVSR